MADIVKKVEMRVEGDGTYNEVLYPKTSVDMVIGAETPAGAQAKANQAETNAKNASVPTSRTVNGLALSSNISLNHNHVGAVNAIASGSSANPNTTQESYILTNHANSPDNSKYWHIHTYFYSSRTGNRVQQAIEYNPTNLNEPRMFIRSYFNSWGAWREVTGGGGSMPVLVASSTLQHSFDTQRTVSTNSAMLVGKFIPEATGEIRVSAEMMRTDSNTGTNRLFLVVVGSSSNSYTLPMLPYPTNFNGWDTPIGASVMSIIGLGGSILSETSKEYNTQTNTILVSHNVPIYFALRAETSVAGRIRNLRIYYDVIKP